MSGSSHVRSRRRLGEVAMEIRFVGMGMGWELLNERAMELWLEIIGMAGSERGWGWD